MAMPPNPAHQHHQMEVTSAPPGATLVAVSPTMSVDDDDDDDNAPGISSTSWQANELLSPTGSSRTQGEEVNIVIKLEESISDLEIPMCARDDRRAMPMAGQNNRRVARACDDCRRKKIKCCGKQPCTHCSLYNNQCTYDKPSNRRRNPAPQYIEALEDRLRRTEALLRKYVPGIDLHLNNLEPLVTKEFMSQGLTRMPTARHHKQRLVNGQDGDRDNGRGTDGEKKKDDNGDNGDENDDNDQIVAVIDAAGHLDRPEDGEYDFYGLASAAISVRSMQEHLRGVIGREPMPGLVMRPPRPPSLDAGDGDGTVCSLPPREYAQQLCAAALCCATCLLRIVHVPSFRVMLDHLYDTAAVAPDAQPTLTGQRDLALVYAVLALGTVYIEATTAEATAEAKTTASATASVSLASSGAALEHDTAEEGRQYFAAARRLLGDPADCCDITTLQALLFLVLFLQATSQLDACSLLLGLAVRAALRMGLHRHLPHVPASALEHELRRRVFSVVRQLDVSVSALMGLSPSLWDDATGVDQQQPTEVDDEFVTADGIVTPPPDVRPSVFQACNAYTRLLRVLGTVLRSVYPTPTTATTTATSMTTTSIYRVRYATVRAIDLDLRGWYEALPLYWRPAPDGPVEVVRIRTLLRFAYAHVQLLMYRPFLHYASLRVPSCLQPVPDRYYACAANAVSTARNVVHLGLELQRQGLRVGPHWFVLSAELVAIIILVYYSLGNAGRHGTVEIMADALAGKAVLVTYAQTSVAAKRVVVALNSLFDQLPDSFRTTNAALDPSPVPEPLTNTSSRPREGSSASCIQRSTDVGRPSLKPVGEHASLDRTQIQMHQQHQLLHQQQQPQLLQHSPLQGPSPTQPYFNFHGLNSLVMPSTTSPGSPDGTSTTDHSSLSSFPTSQTTSTTSIPGPAPPSSASAFSQTTPAAAVGSSSSVYELGEILLPTHDRIVYPSQTLDGEAVGEQYSGLLLPSRLQPQQQHAHGSASSYTPTSRYSNMGNRLSGRVPPYVFPTTEALMSNGGLDLVSDLYPANNLLTLQQVPLYNTPTPQSQVQPLQHRVPLQDFPVFDDDDYSSIFPRVCRWL